MKDRLLEWMSFRSQGYAADLPPDLAVAEKRRWLLEDMAVLGHIEVDRDGSRTDRAPERRLDAAECPPSVEKSGLQFPHRRAGACEDASAGYRLDLLRPGNAPGPQPRGQERADRIQ